MGAAEHDRLEHECDDDEQPFLPKRRPSSAAPASGTARNRDSSIIPACNAIDTGAIQGTGLPRMFGSISESDGDHQPR